MKCLLLLAACLGIVALASITEAYPQRVYVQKLPYYPPPTRQPTYMRARRSVVLEDSVATNPKGGQDVSLKVSKTVGNDHVQGAASVFAGGNTKGGNVVRGAEVGVATHGLSASVTKTQDDISESFRKQAQANLKIGDSNFITGKVSQTDTKIKGVDFKPQQTSSSLAWQNGRLGAGISRDIDRGVSDTLTKSLSANLFNNDKHNLDATVFRSNVLQDNGFSFKKTGGLLDYSHANGHGLNAGLTRFHGIGDQANAGGYATLFKSNDGFTTLKANAGGSQWLNGPYSGTRDFGFGLGLGYNGWRG